MQATGVVRRIDDLGRIVIPKEIRRTMRLREGDPLEILVQGAGEIVLKKYSVMQGLSAFSQGYAEALSRASGMVCAVCDTDRVIVSTGAQRHQWLALPIACEVEDIMARRATYFRQFTGEKNIYPFAGCNMIAVGVAPLIANGDCAGAVIMLSADGVPLSDANKKLLALTASLMSNNLEE